MGSLMERTGGARKDYDSYLEYLICTLDCHDQKSIDKYTGAYFSKLTRIFYKRLK